MSNNAINVRQVFRDTLGKVRANGLVYFYVNKTTTLASIFSDEDLTVPQSNPYTLNAYGEIQGDVKYNGKMTVKHTNSDGSLPLTDDDVETSASDITVVEQFQTVENSPAAMTVIVKTGKVMNGETLVSIADQTTTVIVAPVTNPRIDRIVINRVTGVYSIVAGTEAVSPASPAIPADSQPSSQFTLQTTTTAITTALIVDERVSGSIDHSNAASTETLTNKTITSPTVSGLILSDASIVFEGATADAFETTLTVTDPTADRTVTIQDSTDTLVGRATTDTLTNKTIGDTNTINAQDDAFTIDDAADATKQIDFAISSGTSSTKTTIQVGQTANRTISLPNITDTLVSKNSIDTLTNKTIGDTNTINAQDDAFVIQANTSSTRQLDFSVVGSASTKTTIQAVQTADRTVTIPDATDTLVGKATTDTLTNKTIGDTNTINAQDDAFTIDDAADATLQIDFNAAGTTGTKTTITGSQTANRVLTLPDATDTLVGRATTDTLTNKTIGNTNTVNAQTDAFDIQDATTATKTVDFDISGATASTTTTLDFNQTANRTLTLPDVTDTIVTKTTTDTLTNKTLTSPTHTGTTTVATLVNATLTLNGGYYTADTTSTSLGNTALDSLNTGSARNCTAMGNAALTASTTGTDNCAFGSNALDSSTTGSDNCAFGVESLTASTTGSNNCAFGYRALRLTTANDNCAFGRRALDVNTTGIDNCAFGSSALDSNTTGSDNCAFGRSALAASTEGVQNTAVGESSGNNTTTGDNTTMLGYNAASSTATVDNQVTLGNSSVATLRCQVTTITALSDKRDKDNIQDLSLGLGFINKLRPVSFDWDMRDGGKVGVADTGFIAQDLQEVQSTEGDLPGLVHDLNPEKLEAGYGKLLPVMVKAIQDLSEQNKKLISRIEMLEGSNL